MIKKIRSTLGPILVTLSLFDTTVIIIFLILGIIYSSQPYYPACNPNKSEFDKFLEYIGPLELIIIQITIILNLIIPLVHLVIGTINYFLLLVKKRKPKKTGFVKKMIIRGIIGILILILLYYLIIPLIVNLYNCEPVNFTYPKFDQDHNTIPKGNFIYGPGV